MATICAVDFVITSRSRAPRREASMSADTWWNSSMANRESLKAAGGSFSKANRKVAWVHTRIGSEFPKKSTKA